MSKLRYTRIQGVNFPSSVPHDFADQIRGLLKKYNQLVDDMLVYHETIIELRKSNESLKSQNKNLTAKIESLEDEHNKLKDSYEALKELSEKVASKYEAEARQPSRNQLTAKDIKSKYRQTPEIKRLPVQPIQPVQDESSDEETFLEVENVSSRTN